MVEAYLWHARVRDPLSFVTDERWALPIADLRSGAGLAIWLLWVATTVGRAVGAIGDPQRYGLDFVLTAIFVAMLAVVALRSF